MAIWTYLDLVETVEPEKGLPTADEGLNCKVSTHSRDKERNEVLTKVWP